MNTKIIHTKKILFAALCTLSIIPLLKALDNEDNSNTFDNIQTEEKQTRFICQSKGEVGGIVCQMHTCKDGACQAKTFNLEKIDNTQEEIAGAISTRTESEEAIPAKEEIIEQRVEQLEDEIKLAEKACERAETDPREKAICERASAKVQMKKEKIKALEHMAQE